MNRKRRSRALIDDLLSGNRFAWYGQRASDSVGIDHFLDFELIMCCDYGQDTELIADMQESTILSLEARSHMRENWTSTQLERVMEVVSSRLDTILSSQDSPLWVVAYSSTHSLANYERLSSGRVRAIMPEPNLKSYLDDKLMFAEAVRNLHLASPFTAFTTVSKLQDAGDSLPARLPFVAQLPSGSSGTGTYFVETRNDLTQLSQLAKSTPVLIRSFVEGISLNVNACLLGDRILVSSPSVQLVGLPVATTRKEVYCGNDYSAAQLLPQIIHKRTQECVQVIGRWLYQLGYQGMFGIDAIANLDTLTIYPVDLNARYQNSTYLLTQNVLAVEGIPMPIAAVAWELANSARTSILNSIELEPLTPAGSQIILHSLCDGLASVNGQMSPGIYKEESGMIRRVRPGTSLLDIVSHDEFVITCAVPFQHTFVMPGAPLCKILSWESVYDIHRRQLFPRFQKICSSAYQLLDLQVGR